ncbi:MAG: HypC/HybG/HupF family hydrogenase formation chaperone [Clostridiaceae bacterium]|jgi:hydrogenase expression/formation protein HypC|nr:HypC/HybG/HupF family hydrogenase formation chaperone [Clostridiaceae bacterium]
MCLGIPLKIIQIDGKEAVGEINNISKKIRIDFVPQVKIGDFVMVHAGFALDLMEEEEAKETIDILNDVMEASK